MLTHYHDAIVRSNPYLTFFVSLPPAFRRDPLTPPDSRELASADWLFVKAAIASHFSWAVPTSEAITTIRRHASAIVEIGCGSGYWAWMMAQAGISVVAYDAAVPAFTWHKVLPGNELAVLEHGQRTLFICWPPLWL